MSLVSESLQRKIGFGLSYALGAFLLLDGVMKVVQPAPVLEACLHLGYSTDLVAPVGMILLFCTALYLVPRTQILGAIFLTGYFGGALASHLRVEGGPIPMLFVFAFGVITWFGLYLRDPRVRALFPKR